MRGTAAGGSAEEPLGEPVSYGASAEDPHRGRVRHRGSLSMTLLVETPPTRLAERRYALSVVLGEWLGLRWSLRPVERSGVRISVAEGVGEVTMPDLFLDRAAGAWLEPSSLPRPSDRRWDATPLGRALRVVDRAVPAVLDGDAGAFRIEGRAVHLPIDVFGVAFLMLSRYEELLLVERDEHDRIPAEASLAARGGFLDRPVVDEQVELLHRALRMAMPGLPALERAGRLKASCDVDRPFDPDAGSTAWLLRRVAGDLLRRGTMRGARGRWAQFRGARRGDRRDDPFNTFEWMMRTAEAAGRRIRFHFMATDDPGPIDVRYRIEDPWIRALLRSIHERGHEIGLHGSYASAVDAERLGRERLALQRVLDEEGIEAPVATGRQHYLRWCPRRTPRVLEAAGLEVDSTLGFADRPGFRCGSCRSFPMYDLAAATPLRLRQEPLVCMECSVLGTPYLALDPDGEGGRTMRSLRDACGAVGGDFTLLWHNSELHRSGDRRLYAALLAEGAAPIAAGRAAGDRREVRQ